MNRRLIAAGAGLAVLLWILITHWQFVVGLFFNTIFAVITAAIIYYVFRELGTDKNKTAIITLCIFAVLFIFSWRCASFHCQIAQLEKKFMTAANTMPREITPSGTLNYGGGLTAILDERNELLRHYWYRMAGDWWVDTDRGPTINASYYFCL